MTTNNFIDLTIGFFLIIANFLIQSLLTFIILAIMAKLFYPQLLLLGATKFFMAACIITFFFYIVSIFLKNK